MRIAHSATRSPSGVKPEKRGLRATSLMSSSRSSDLKPAESVDCVTLHACAARAKCFSRASATRYVIWRMNIRWSPRTEMVDASMGDRHFQSTDSHAEFETTPRGPRNPIPNGSRVVRSFASRAGYSARPSCHGQLYGALIANQGAFAGFGDGL